MPIGLKFKASLDDSAFMAGIRRIKTAGAGLARGVGGAGRGAGRAGGAFFGIGAGAIGAAGAGMFARAVVKDADALYNLSRKTGMSTTSLAALAEMGKQANIEMEQLAASVTLMQSNLAKGAPATKKALEDMGIAFDDLKGLKPEEQFAKIGDALSKMSNQNAKASAARGVFGRGGPSMFELFDDIGKMDMNKVSGNARRMGEAAKDLSDVSDMIAGWYTTAKSYGASAINQLTNGQALAKIGAYFQPSKYREVVPGGQKRTAGARNPFAGFKTANQNYSPEMAMMTSGFWNFANKKEKDAFRAAHRSLVSSGLTAGELGGASGFDAHGRVSRGDAARARAAANTLQKKIKDEQKANELREQIKTALENIQGTLDESLE